MRIVRACMMGARGYASGDLARSSEAPALEPEIVHPGPTLYEEALGMEGYTHAGALALRGSWDGANPYVCVLTDLWLWVRWSLGQREGREMTCDTQAKKGGESL